MKRIICLETKEIFESSASASEWLKCTRQSVNNQLKGNAKSVCGYHFMYYDEYVKELK